MRTIHDELRDMGDAINTLPVIVVGSTDSCLGVKRFKTFTEAKQALPTLDPFHNGQDFTWATRDDVDGKLAMRFESWKAYNMYSAS